MFNVNLGWQSVPVHTQNPEDDIVSQGVIEFSRNVQSWQCCHYCVTSDGNKFYVTVHYHLTYFQIKEYKNVNIDIFVYYEKTRMIFKFQLYHFRKPSSQVALPPNVLRDFTIFMGF